MFETGTANDYLDLLDKLDTFLTATGSAFGLTYAGTGNGTLHTYKGGASSVAEVFTITATSATNFTVVGSTTGSIGPATVGTPFSHGTIAFTITAGGTPFVSGDVFTLSTAPKWTQKLGPVTATSTRWRINVGVTEGGGSFLLQVARFELMTTRGGADVAEPDGTGVPSSSSEHASHPPDDAFDTDNATYWESLANDGWLEFEFTATKAIVEIALTTRTGASTDNNSPLDFTVEYYNGSNWVIAATFRQEAGQNAGERRTYQLAPYIWEAPGNDGAANILVGAHPIENAGIGFYNWRLNGFTAYEGSTDFHSMPGSINSISREPYGPIVPLSNASTSYWFVVNGRRVVVVAKVGAAYSAAYLGLIQPYASPGQWPLPLFVGGSLWFGDEPAMDDTDWAVSTAHDSHTSFPMSLIAQQITGVDLDISSSARLRLPTGEWLGFSGYSPDTFYDTKDDIRGNLWPYAFGFRNLKPNLDGDYSLFPVILLERSPANAYGQLDGVHSVSGSSLTAEADIAIGLHSYIGFPDATRSGPGDFFAVKMD